MYVHRWQLWYLLVCYDLVHIFKYELYNFPFQGQFRGLKPQVNTFKTRKCQTRFENTWLMVRDSARWSGKISSTSSCSSWNTDQLAILWGCLWLERLVLIIIWLNWVDKTRLANWTKEFLRSLKFNKAIRQIDIFYSAGAAEAAEILEIVSGGQTAI